MTIVSDAQDDQPHIDGTDVTVIDVYQAYAGQGMEPAEVADELNLDLARVHEAIAFYYDHAEVMRGRTPEKIAELTGGDEGEMRGGFEAGDFRRPDADADCDDDTGFETLSMDEFARENQDADEL